MCQSETSTGDRKILEQVLSGVEEERWLPRGPACVGLFFLVVVRGKDLEYKIQNATGNVNINNKETLVESEKETESWKNKNS